MNTVRDHALIKDALKAHLMREGLLSGAAKWTSLLGGRTNDTWLVSDSATQMVVKLYATSAKSSLFENDPELEWLCLEALSPNGLAPRPIHRGDTPVGAVLCSRYEATGGNAPPNPFSIGRFLSQLHSVNAPSALPKRSCPLPWTDRVTALFGTPPEAPAKPARQQVFLHGDPVVTNFLATDPVMAVDWQCPAIGDPCDDIAIYLSPGMQHIYANGPLSQTERNAFWQGYNDPPVAERYADLQPAYHTCLAAYFRSRNTELDREAAILEEQGHTP